MKPSNSLDRTLASNKLTVNEESRVISNIKPKIRIIHIVAPEIITTDVENFRDLVQRLTGKHAERRGSTKKRRNVSSEVMPSNTYATKERKNMESPSVPFVQTTNRMKKENEETYEMENPNSFLSFLGEVDGFIHDMNEFPLLPLRSSQINTFGEMPLC